MFEWCDILSGIKPADGQGTANQRGTTWRVTGDLHGGLDIQKLRDWEAGERLTRSDFLIVAGDFGYPWDFSPEECEEVAWLESRPYTLLFVDGNHERYATGRSAPTSSGMAA